MAQLVMLRLSQRFVTPYPRSQIPILILVFKMKSLEDDIRAMLAMLRRHINPLESPLYSLPQDLLPEVASHLASETDLINATHVSHHFRSALLSYPSLWSHLDFQDEMTARMFFERSGQTLLHVDMDRDITRTVDILTELRQQSKRIETLKLRHWWVQKKFLSEPLPSLRRLEIFSEHCDDWDEGWDEDWDTVWTPVWGPVEKATSWSFPSLTSLIIYDLSPIPFHTPNLTRLMFWNQESPDTAGSLISFLGSCPLLEHIDISYAGGIRGRHNLVVSLPNLRTYTETTFDDPCPLTVFNALSLPPSCSVTLRFQDGSETAAAVNDTLTQLRNSSGYLAEIKRVKLGITHDADGNEEAGTLELVNAKGTKVCSEIVVLEEEGYQQSLGGEKNHTRNSVHLDFLRNLDGQSVEILCIDGYSSRDFRGVPVEFLKEALGFGSVRTLILSRGAVEPCLLALEEDLDASDNSQWFLSINNLIICPGPDRSGSYHKVLLSLFSLVRKKKADGSPLNSVSLALHSDLGWRWNRVLELLRSCVEKLEVVTGDDVLDWDVDKYFLDGLESLRKNREIQWD